MFSQLPLRFQTASLEQFKGKLGKERSLALLDWLEKLKGFLILISPPGVGKTHLASAVFNYFKELLKEPEDDEKVKIRPLFVNSTKLFSSIRSIYQDDKKHYYRSELITETYIIDQLLLPNTLAVFDDVGAEKPTEFVLATWYRIINERYENLMPTLFTTNLTPEQLEAKLGERLSSRILSGKLMFLEGEDMRTVGENN